MKGKKSGIFVYMVLVMAVLLAKILGLLRGIVFSSVYGTGLEASAFTAVSNLPLTIFDITFGTAINAAFVPVFNEKLMSDGKEGANKFASNFLNIVLIFSALIVFLVILFPKFAVLLVASGFEGKASAMSIAVVLMRLIAPVITFACCTYIFIGLLQSYEEFVAPALVSLLSNFAMIVYLLFLNGRFKINGLAIAFSVGWFLQFAFLIPFLIKKKFKYSFTIDFKSKDIAKVVILTLPLFVASLAQPINQIISSNFSSRVSESGIATVSYAYNAYLIVAGVFSYALTNMFFPKMSRKFAQNDVGGATEICRNMLSAITAIIIPIMVFVSTCSGPIIKLLYQRGEFAASDTRNVSSLLTIYAIAMIALSWQDIFNKYFYSMQKTLPPMFSAIIGIVVNIALSFLFIDKLGLKGLATATVISGFTMVAVLSFFSFKYTKKIFIGKFIAEIAKILVSGVLCFVVCKVLVNVFDFGMSLAHQIIFILIILIVALLSYILTLFLLKSENIIEFKSVLKKGDGTSDV